MLSILGETNEQIINYRNQYSEDINVSKKHKHLIEINGEEYVIEHEHPNYRKNHAYNTSLMEIDDQYMNKEYKHMHRFENEDGTVLNLVHTHHNPFQAHLID